MKWKFEGRKYEIGRKQNDNLGSPLFFSCDKFYYFELKMSVIS